MKNSIEDKKVNIMNTKEWDDLHFALEQMQESMRESHMVMERWERRSSKEFLDRVERGRLYFRLYGFFGKIINKMLVAKNRRGNHG